MIKNLSTWTPVILLLLVVGIAVGILVSPVLSAAVTPAAYPPPATPGPTQAGIYPPPQTLAPAQPDNGAIYATQSAPAPTPTAAPSWAAEAARAYIAQTKGIPVEALVIGNDHFVDTPNLKRQFQAVTLLDSRPHGAEYELLVDLKSRQVIEDVAAIYAAEEQAGVVKYGKLQKALYERLQSMRDNDVVAVGIWVVAGPGQSMIERQAAAYAMIAAKYPEARAALEQHGNPMAVPDLALSRQIRKEYDELVAAPVAMQVQPLMEALQAQGYTPKFINGLPVVWVSLSKQELLQIEQRNDVGAIDLDNQDPIQNMDIIKTTTKAQVIMTENLWLIAAGAGLIIISVGFVYWRGSKRK
jgi:hypothetical protein